MNVRLSLVTQTTVSSVQAGATHGWNVSNLPGPIRMVSPAAEASTAGWMSVKSPEPSNSTRQVRAPAVGASKRIAMATTIPIRMFHQVLVGGGRPKPPPCHADGAIAPAPSAASSPHRLPRVAPDRRHWRPSSRGHHDRARSPCTRRPISPRTRVGRFVQPLATFAPRSSWPAQVTSTIR